MDYSTRIKMPDPKSINTTCSAARVRTMVECLGDVKRPLSANCDSSKASDKVSKLLVTADVGPFRVTGIKPFVELLTRVFKKVEKENPELYKQLGTAGVFCVRLVRGSLTSPSNHSWGTAIDIKINGVLDPRGDGYVQKGLLELYKYFKAEKCFWGAGFSTEDGMHFEASDELIRKWKANGVI